MSQAIKIINLWGESFLLKSATGVNCYLVKTNTGFILIDTGLHAKRADLLSELEGAGCLPGDLRLIIITHGDLDHVGNCAYLREKYGTRVAVPRDETEAVERGHMALNRTNRSGCIGGAILSLLSLFSLSDRFTPDITIEEGHDFSEYGFDARVIEIPGHSKGSIGILTADGDLFCGDLLQNLDRPAPSGLIDDPAAQQASVEKLKPLTINTVYPGHGTPFLMEQYLSGSGGDTAD